MTYILNEHEWARDMIESRSLGKKSFETLSRVARYYMDEGYKRDEARRLLELFLLQCRPDASSALWMDTLDKAVSYAEKHKAIMIDRIIVTKPEMDAIAGLDGVQARRLAFTLLCLAKYYDAINPRANHWVCAEDSDIMAMANIITSMRRQCAMYKQLREAGMIAFSRRVDNTNVCVLFVSNGEPAIEIDDMRNLGNQYLFAVGVPGFFRCSDCGIIAKNASGRLDRETRGRIRQRCDDCTKNRQHRGSDS